MTVALLAVAAAAPYVSYRLAREAFSPAAVVVMAWCSTLALLGLDLLPYRQIGSQTAALIAGTVTLLALGIVAGTWLGGRATGTPRAPVRLAHPAITINVLALAGLAGTAWFVQAVVSRYDWAVFGRGAELRWYLTNYDIPSRYLFLQFFCVVTPLVTWALMMTGVRFRVWQLALPIAATLCTGLTTDRTQFFTVLLSGFFMYTFRRGPALPVGRLFAIAAVGPAILLANFLIVGAWTGKSPAQLKMRLQLPDAPAGSQQARVYEALQQGTVVYFYATAPYPALDRLLAEKRPRTNGRHTLYPVLRALSRAGLIEIDLPLAIPAFLPISDPSAAPPLQTNSFTFIYYPLEDFGPVGALAYAAVVGLLVGAVYGWARRQRGSAARTLVMGQVCTAVALTFFVNKFNSTAFWYILLWTLVPCCLAWLIRRRAMPSAALRPEHRDEAEGRERQDPVEAPQQRRE